MLNGPTGPMAIVSAVEHIVSEMRPITGMFKHAASIKVRLASEGVVVVQAFTATGWLVYTETVFL